MRIRKREDSVVTFVTDASKQEDRLMIFVFFLFFSVVVSTLGERVLFYFTSLIFMSFQINIYIYIYIYIKLKSTKGNILHDVMFLFSNKMKGDIFFIFLLQK